MNKSRNTSTKEDDLMEILRQENETAPPCPRGFVATISIRSFKGRRDVLVHLFRPSSDDSAQDYDWNSLVQHDENRDVNTNRGDTREVILESFSKDELDSIVRYLAGRYADRLTSITTNTLRFPLPAGLLPLRSMPEGKDMGRIRFEIVPGYPLAFPVHGLYDLSQHKPIDQRLDD